MSISLKARALRYLAARDHSRIELARKLARHAQEGDDIEALLDQMEALKFLSTERFTENLVRRRSERFGDSRILQELKQHGVNPDASLKAQLGQDEVQRAQQVWEKKFGTLPQDASERGKQMRFLAQRGFSQRTISRVLRGDIEE
ncbi:MAG: RecX regulatory protein [Pseudomonadota bacterium]|jgi:regulatory protein